MVARNPCIGTIKQYRMFHRTLAAQHDTLVIILPDQENAAMSPPATPQRSAAPPPIGWQAETTTTFLVFMGIGFAATITVAAVLTVILCSVRCDMLRVRT